MKQLTRMRAKACKAQNQRCHYCSVLMCPGDVEDFAARHKLPIGVAQGLRCTAEHLVPRSEGGRNVIQNIVAACRFCNAKRHARPQPLLPDDYLHHVQRRLRRRAWHDSHVWFAGLIDGTRSGGHGQRPTTG